MPHPADQGPAQSGPLDLRTASRAVAAGALSATDLVEASLARISLLEGEIRAWVHIDAEGARAAARTLDTSPYRGPLHGIPIGVKDIIDVAGLPTECGSSLRTGHLATQDAWIVAWLRQQGAIVIGKTVTTEFAYFTPGPTRNPHNLAHTPGGSSSGSAAAVATGMVPLALGTQTAASTIRPAAYCGIAGIVTTPGWGSGDGITGLSHTLDSIGFLTRSCADLSLLFPSSTPRTPPRLLLWSPNHVSADMQATINTAGTTLAAGDAIIHALDFDDHAEHLSQAHATIMAHEAAQALNQEARTGKLSRRLQQLLDTGRDLTETEVQAARRVMAEARDWLARQTADYDAILAPAAPGAAPRGLAATGDPVMSRPWQALGLPTIAIPGATDPDDLPLGLQVVGAPDAEAQLVTTACWVEQNLSSQIPHSEQRNNSVR